MHDGLSVADTFQGNILDIDAARALTWDDTVTPSVVRLFDRAADTSQIILTAPNANQYVGQGFLPSCKRRALRVRTRCSAMTSCS